MKNYLYLLTISFLFITSCGEGFLHHDPQGSFDYGSLKNETGVNLLTTNAYAILTQSGWGASVFNWTFGGIYGGDANKGSDTNDQAVINDMEIFNPTSSDTYPSVKWDWVYKGAKRVNITLQTIDDCENLPPDFVKNRQGELFFLRALVYFEGVKVFGPMIPWVDDSILENDPKVHNNINIYPKIVEDLDRAIENLSTTQDRPGRANAWAAKALKAKVLMQNGQFKEALPIIKDVVENGETSNGIKYGLEDNLNDNFNAFKDNGKESIFAVQFSNDMNNANPGMSLCYPYGGGPGGCCGFYQPSNELANSYKVDDNGLPFLDDSYRNAPFVSEKNSNIGKDAKYLSINNDIFVDPRLDFAVGRYGIPYKDWGLPQNDWIRDVNNGGFYTPKKHVYSKKEEEAGLAARDLTAGWAPGSAMNLQYLSFRDILLLYAECLAENGNLSEAMNSVNKIRERAANPQNIILNEKSLPAAKYKVSPYPMSHPAFSNKETCVKAIRMERKLELAMEGQRWFDLVRWGGDYMAKTLADYIDFEKKFILKFTNAQKISPVKTMFPIPSSQVDLMGNDENGIPYLVQPEPWR